MKWTGILIDDENLAREKLRRLVTELNDPEIAVIGEASDGIQAIELTDTLKPDFIVLDIQMPGLTGLEVLRNLNHKPAVIFSTAYDTYAIKAFELNAVDYLLKPFDRERLSQAIARVKSRGTPTRADEMSTRKLLEDILNRERHFLERLPTRVGERIRLMRVEDILWFDSEDSITFAHAENQTSDVRYTLDELEQQLDPGQFFRAHRSAIVNLNRIAEIVPWFSGKYKIIMSDPKKSEIVLARGRAQELKDKLHW